MKGNFQDELDINGENSQPTVGVDPNQKYPIHADHLRPAPGGGFILSGSHVSIDLPFEPQRYLKHGWQSWSLTAWIETASHPPILRTPGQFPKHFDPVYARVRHPHGAWFGAVETPDGEVLFLGSLGLEAHVELDRRSLVGRYETGSGEWFFGAGAEAKVFARYASLLAMHFGKGRLQQGPRVWCSWYSLYTEIDQPRLLKILNDLGDLPFEVFQIDDGWQKGIGDWEPNGKFPLGMDGLARGIQASGKIAGLWLAPLLVTPAALLYRNHPDWLLHDDQGKLVSAGINWGQQLYALDTTHPQVLEWLAALMKRVRAWGYDYVKLDFLYAGALPGRRHDNRPREAAYRHGLAVMREALGEAYLLTCGAPILPSLGLCDGMRVGPDVAPYWNNFLSNRLLMDYATPGVQNALRTVSNRFWLRELVNTDPDVVYFQTRHNDLTAEQKALLQDLARIAGFKATSDLPGWLSEGERSALKRFLETSPRIESEGRSSFRIDGRSVDFAPFIRLPTYHFLYDVLGWIAGKLGDWPPLVHLFIRIWRRALQKTLAKDL